MIPALNVVSIDFKLAVLILGPAVSMQVRTKAVAVVCLTSRARLASHNRGAY